MGWKAELTGAKRIAFDIEINEGGEILCVAFAASPSRAYVFTNPADPAIREILACEAPKCAQNGLFDLRVLQKNDVEVRNYADDTILAWHACYPELAGASQDKRAKHTRKSLAFLASVFTYDAWWKDYDTDDAGMYELCGRDACITFDVMSELDDAIDKLGVRAIYEHQLRLIPACLAMQERGLLIDERLRRASLEEIQSEAVRLAGQLREDVEPIFRQRRDIVPRKRLFWKSVTCPCCRNGKNKRAACWSCAGLDHNPTKKERRAQPHISLTTCNVCKGVGKWEEFEFNPNSPEQVKIWLYDVLKMPKKLKDKRLTSDEEALKALLATVGGEDEQDTR